MRYQHTETSALERGQGLVEYALALVLVAVVVILALAFLGEGIRKQYCSIVYSIDANADVPLCEAVDVSCVVQTTNPFRFTANVTDSAGDNNIKKVEFYVDGHLNNYEVRYRYCLVGGDDGLCSPYYIQGTHEFRAVAYDEDGNVGSCTMTATVP